MTLTTHVRINAHIEPVALLEYMSEFVKPADWGERPVMRRGSGHWSPDSKWSWVEDDVCTELFNEAGQGLDSLLHVRWCDEPSTLHSYLWSGEHEISEEDSVQPLAIVDFSMDNPYGSRGDGYNNAYDFHMGMLIPHLAKWLDAHGVARSDWHWQNESTGEWFAGDVTPTGYEQTGRDAANFANVATTLILSELKGNQ